MPNDYISPSEIRQLLLWRQECDRLAEEESRLTAEDANRFCNITIDEDLEEALWN